MSSRNLFVMSDSKMLWFCEVLCSFSPPLKSQSDGSILTSGLPVKTTIQKISLLLLRHVDEYSRLSIVRAQSPACRLTGDFQAFDSNFASKLPAGKTIQSCDAVAHQSSFVNIHEKEMYCPSENLPKRLLAHNESQDSP